MTLEEIPRWHIDDEGCPEHYVRVLSARSMAELEPALSLLYRNAHWVLIDLDHFYCLALAVGGPVDCRTDGLVDR